VTTNFADFAEGRCTLINAVESMPEIGVDFMLSTSDLTDLLGRLSAANFRRIVRALRKQYGLVIMNGPTGTEGPEVGLLADRADVVLFAVRWGVTRRHEARAALEQVSRNATHPIIIKSVLTEVTPKYEKRFQFGESGDLLRTRPKAIAVDLPAMRWPPSRQSKGLPIA
jgi:MinD-like ATPase involved in chromosome partitioning or flagellar assembly